MPNWLRTPSAQSSHYSIAVKPQFHAVSRWLHQFDRHLLERKSTKAPCRSPSRPISTARNWRTSSNRVRNPQPRSACNRNCSMLELCVMNLEFAATTYRVIRDRIRAQDPQIDEQTLADTVEGLTDLHEIVQAIIRAALSDEALVLGLKCRISDMQGRLDRLQDRASKRRQIARDVMVELDLKKLNAPDFTASIREGIPSLTVIDEEAVPSIYWQPSEPRLNRQELAYELKQGSEISGVALSDPEPILSVRVR